MLKKSKRRLVHVFDFISLKGKIRVTRDNSLFIPSNHLLNARKIIYLGLNRDL
jgi:hypothetical protein